MGKIFKKNDCTCDSIETNATTSVRRCAVFECWRVTVLIGIIILICTNGIFNKRCAKYTLQQCPSRHRVLWHVQSTFQNHALVKNNFKIIFKNGRFSYQKNTHIYTHTHNLQYAEHQTKSLDHESWNHMNLWFFSIINNKNKYEKKKQ